MATEIDVNTRDPFTQTYDAIWEALEQCDEFARRVSLGNRISLTDGSPTPEKSRLLDADTPECTLEPAGSTIDLIATSSSTVAVQSYAIRVATGDRRPNKALFPIKWALMKALVGVGKTLGGLSFVRRYTLEYVVEEPDGDERISGWSLLATIVVEMQFTQETVAA